MFLKSTVGLASVASSLVFLGAVSFFVYMFNDINNFYDDSLKSIEEFNVSANYVAYYFS